MEQEEVAAIEAWNKRQNRYNEKCEERKLRLASVRERLHNLGGVESAIERMQAQIEKLKSMVGE
jgi:ppGpp synthetase/RelA/SpoT-type nucleotidyltranferase